MKPEETEVKVRPMFTIAIRIDRPTANVFACLLAVDQAPRWYSEVQSVAKLTPGPVGRGTRYAFTRELGGRTLENTVEITELDDGKQFTLSSLSGPTPFVYRYRLEADGNATSLRLEGTITGAGLNGPQALFAPLASRFFEQGMRTNLLSLKHWIESEPAWS